MDTGKTKPPFAEIKKRRKQTKKSEHERVKGESEKQMTEQIRCSHPLKVARKGELGLFFLTDQLQSFRNV